MTDQTNTAPFIPGQQVVAEDRSGVIESVAFSVATQAWLYVVAHDERTRLTYRACEIRPAT